MTRLCAFCGSSPGVRVDYADAARRLGAELVRRRVGLVYGGGSLGLMGVLADAVLGAGGEVVGIIPGALASRERAHPGLTELRIVGSMHERKALMGTLADGFVALPGGLGTLEELLEVLTWSQLGIHRKPVALLNTADYWNALLALLAHAVQEGFVAEAPSELLLVAETPVELLDRIAAWRPADVTGPWLDPSQT